MKIRTAKREEVMPKAHERQPSPRQVAAMERDAQLAKALARLKTDDDVVAIDLDDTDKIPTMRVSVKKAIATHRPEAHMAIRGRTIYLSTGPLPGLRQK